MRFIKYTAVANASGQNVSGIFAVDSNDKPVSTMCLCFLSDKPLC